MVPKFYLKSWSDDQTSTKGSIFVFDKKKNEIRSAKLEDVAERNYAYDISGMSEHDKLVSDCFYLNFLQKSSFAHG